MQIKLFTIPVGDSGAELVEMNRFLKSNKILEVQEQLISNENGAYWCFCVRYIEKAFNQTGHTKTKVDYKHILDDATFQKFSKLREIRKKVAADQGIPAFAVFTDEELAGLAKLDIITGKNMLSINRLVSRSLYKATKRFKNAQCW